MSKSHEVMVEADDIPLDIFAQALAGVGYELTINQHTKRLRITSIRMKTLRVRRQGDGGKRNGRKS